MKQEKFAELVLSVIRTFVSKPSWKTAEIDLIARPVLDVLVEMGTIQNADDAYIEWAGVAEFCLIPVIVYKKEIDDFLYYNVNQDGTVDQF